MWKSLTSTPIAPAIWATAVSALITTSKQAINAAVCSQDGFFGNTSSTDVPFDCSRSTPSCSETQLRVSQIGRSSARGIDLAL